MWNQWTADQNDVGNFLFCLVYKSFNAFLGTLVNET